MTIYLKAWRKHRGIGQVELGKMTHIRQATISRIENGFNEPRYTTLYVLAHALGLTSVKDLSKPPSKNGA